MDSVIIFEIIVNIFNYLFDHPIVGIICFIGVSFLTITVVGEEIGLILLLPIIGGILVITGYKLGLGKGWAITILGVNIIVIIIDAMSSKKISATRMGVITIGVSLVIFSIQYYLNN